MPIFELNSICPACKKEVLMAVTEQDNKTLRFDIRPVYRVVTVLVGKEWRTLVKQQKTNALPIHFCRNDSGQAIDHDPAK